MTETSVKTEESVRENIGRGTPLFADEPTTLAELFIKGAREHDLQAALNYKRDGRWNSIPSAEVIRRAGNIALGLYSLGIRKNDRAAIMSANSPEWTLADAGCQFAGILDVPIYTTLAPNSVQYILNDSEARVIFLEHREMYERIAAELAECKAIEKLIVFDPLGVDLSNAISLEELEKMGEDLRSSDPDLLDSLAASLEPSDISTLIYTSGTTGEPKGVMLTHSNIISNVIDSGAKYTFGESDIPLSVLPLSHIFERSAMYLYFYNGMSVYYAESVDKVPENLRDVRPTILIGVPRIFEKVYAKAKLTAANTPPKKTFRTSSAIGESGYFF